MARRSVQTERPNLTIDQKRRCVARLQRCIADLEAFDPTKVQKRYGVPEVLALEAAQQACESCPWDDRQGYLIALAATAAEKRDEIAPLHERS